MEVPSESVLNEAADNESEIQIHGPERVIPPSPPAFDEKPAPTVGFKLPEPKNDEIEDDEKAHLVIPQKDLEL